MLSVYQTGGSQLGEADLQQTLKASEKKGERTPAEALAWLTPEARGRLEADLATQSRYILLASTFANKSGKKKPNAVISVETVSGSDSARDAVNEALQDDRGKWRLIGSEQHDGVTVLEYLGRLPRKRTPPVSLLDRLRKLHPDVKYVSFRSLRKMLGDKNEGPGPAASEGKTDGRTVNGSTAHWFEPAADPVTEPAARKANHP